jgi:serine/threonine protein kinase
MEAAERVVNAILQLGTRDDPKNCGALKVIHSPENPAEYDKQLDRMKRELAALHSQSHPAIIKILDEKLEERWFVTEYFAGGPLSDNLGLYRGKFLEALRAFRPLVEGVAEMHNKNLVHRDIKPENVFVSASGSPVLGDFGLVYFMDDDRSRVSDTYENVGSRDWMPGWAMGMRLAEVRPSFDVFSLGKLLWSMVSGRAKLRLWYLHSPDFELEAMFPGDPDIRWARYILDRCIVEDEKDCLADARQLLVKVDKVLMALGRHSQVVHDGVKRICRVCGVGNYSEVTGQKSQALSGPGGLRIFECGNCGHAELFRQGEFPAWKTNEIADLAEPAAIPETAIASRAGDLRARVEGADISVSLDSGFAQNFVIGVTNHSYDEIIVQRIRIESNGVEITRPAEPPSTDAWKIPPRSNVVQIGWPASPDPATSLVRKNPNKGIFFREKIDVILRCEILGLSTTITKKLVVQVNATNRQLLQVAG